jgi:drug/metabolite transporter (DMT)-like permease
MTFPHEWLAVGAAACWAMASLSAAPASAHLGAFSFTRWRMVCAALLLCSLATVQGGWTSLSDPALGNPWLLLAVSGVIGIFVGDSALFGCMNRLGPRRSGVLFATHALFSVALAWVFLGETLGGLVALGAVTLVGGVMPAIAFGKRADEVHAWEQVKGALWVGVALGLLAALCQSVATLMLKPLMAAGVDPVAASAVRMLAAVAAHWTLRATGAEVAKPKNPLTPKVLATVAWNAALAMGLGMTLILAALRGGSAGLVAILSSVTPVLLLPLLWVVYKRQPSLAAWAGAALTVAGGPLVLSR